jgi:hypothetical protein
MTALKSNELVYKTFYGRGLYQLELLEVLFEREATPSTYQRTKRTADDAKPFYFDAPLFDYHILFFCLSP